MPQAITNDDQRNDSNGQDLGFATKVRANQQYLTRHLQDAYDFIICGSGSSGSVVARRLAENPAVRVLLLEAGGSDEVPEVSAAGLWPANLGSERDWAFHAEPNPQLQGRSLPMNMGKVLGGGSSINVMIWSRGHKNDWDYFAQEAGDPAWNYESALGIYRRLEDWHGPADAAHRGAGGPVFVQPAPDPNPIAPALLESACSMGLRTFDSPNGRMMEEDGGCALLDLRVYAGKRLSIFRSYTYPYMDQPNLTVLTRALVTRILFEKQRATGVEVAYEGKVHRFRAGREVVLSMGAIQTPKVLLQSGVGHEEELKRWKIPLIEHRPGVGQNFQDHAGPASCMWEYRQPLQPCNNGAEATLFWKSHAGLETPDIQVIQGEVAFASAEVTARFRPPAGSWVLWPGLVRPQSRGYLRLTGPDPRDPIEIHARTFEHPDDRTAIAQAVELCRELGHSEVLRPFVKREVMPGPRRGLELDRFLKEATISVWHQSGTAKMGRDDSAVVDSRLKVYGIESLRIADASIMPRVMTGNTMAACVVIGERVAEMLKADHQF